MQTQYRNYGNPPPTNQRSPGARGSGPMIATSQSTLPPHQLARQQQEEVRKLREQAELAKQRTLRHPVDRNIPIGVEAIAIGDGVQQYRSLREVERKLDAVVMRKRLDIQDSVHMSSAPYGTLRIWLSNTVEDQPWQASAMEHDAFDFSSNVEARFKMKIEGRLLESDNDSSPLDNDTSGQDQFSIAAENSLNPREGDEPLPKRHKLSSSGNPRKKFSHFFKAITIDFDRSANLQPDGYTQIEWKRPDLQPRSQAEPPREADFDCLEFQRKSDENINVTVNLYRDEQPERYKLARPLAELLDMEEADRKTVLMGIWEYIKAAGLQTEDDSKRINCDERLRNIFRADFFSFPLLPDMLRTLMFDLPPISLPYTIRVDKEFHTSGNPPATVYDIPVPLEDYLRAQMHAIITSPTHGATLQSITRIDDRLALLVQAMNHSKAKHGFFTSMSKDPANFVKRWISSQKRDLDVIMGIGALGVEDWQGPEWRKGGTDGLWGSAEAWEGVGSWLSKSKDNPVRS